MKLVSNDIVSVPDGIYNGVIMERSVKFYHDNTKFKFKCTKSIDDYSDCIITVSNNNAIVSLIDDTGRSLGHLINKDELSDIETILIDSSELENDLIFINLDFEHNNCKVYSENENSDLYLVEFNDKKVIVNRYESNNIYVFKDTITIAGLDYNILIDTIDKKIEIKHIR